MLLRLDGGNDAIEIIEVVLAHNEAHKDLLAVNFLIKWNPRRQNKAGWLAITEPKGKWTFPRGGKRVALFNVQTTRHWKEHDYSVRRTIERTIDKHGQPLLVLEIDLEGWWTSLDVSEKDVVRPYADHGTSE